MDVTDAQEWAIRSINLRDGAAATWREFRGDARAWEILDPIGVKSFILGKHQDGWRLVNELSRIGGAPGSEDQIGNWATRAVKHHAKSTIIDWVPEPGTNPDPTTLYGSGTR
jgi:hypothetical protein